VLRCWRHPTCTYPLDPEQKKQCFSFLDLYIGDSSQLVIGALGMKTGIVVQCGHSFTRIVPIYNFYLPKSMIPATGSHGILQESTGNHWDTESSIPTGICPDFSRWCYSNTTIHLYTSFSFFLFLCCLSRYIYVDVSFLFTSNKDRTQTHTYTYLDI